MGTKNCGVLLDEASSIKAFWIWGQNASESRVLSSPTSWDKKIGLDQIVRQPWKTEMMAEVICFLSEEKIHFDLSQNCSVGRCQLLNTICQCDESLQLKTRYKVKIKHNTEKQKIDVPTGLAYLTRWSIVTACTRRLSHNYYHIHRQTQAHDEVWA